jgi:quercetin dioxygenase-like cupin family protein
MSNFIHYCQSFTKATQVKWEDVIKKINYEFSTNTHKYITDGVNSPTFVTHSSFYPGTIQEAFDEVKEKFPVQDLHIYTSFAAKSKTFGLHKDSMNVLIVASIGKVQYTLEGNQIVTLQPGDALFIPEGMYHDPTILEPRVTLSFGLPT